MLFRSAIPKLMFQSYSKAEKLVMEQINKIKRGEFSDEMFTALKNNEKKKNDLALESINNRMDLMMELFSQNTSMDDFQKHSEKIEMLTKEDVINAANKYFGDNYLYISKKTGSYPKDEISKPDFAPIPMNHDNKNSQYALNLDASAPQELPTVEIIDFEKVTNKIKINDLVTLYVTPNKVNDLFNLSVVYETGSMTEPMTAILEDYLSKIGRASCRERVYVLV